jgi:hypothetical protein
MDDFDRTAAAVDLTLWDAEMYFGDRDPLEVMRLWILEQVRVVDLSSWVEPLE